MGLPSTGSISMSQVNTELKKSATATISLNDSAVRKLAGKTSGTISMNDLRGKKASESVTNYPVYSRKEYTSAYGSDFTINFPHKVISGTLIVDAKGYEYNYGDNLGKSAVINILGKSFINKTVNFQISNVSSISGSFRTGYLEYEGFTKNGFIEIDIKFTGEWEVQRRNKQ